MKWAGSPVKILLVSSEYPPESPGGIGNAIKNLAVGVQSLGAVPVVLSFTGGKTKRGLEDGITVYRIKRQKRRLPPKRLWFWRFRAFNLPIDCLHYSRIINQACRRIIDEENIQVVQFNDYKGEGYFFKKTSTLPYIIFLATPLYFVYDINRSNASTAWMKNPSYHLAMQFVRHLEQRPIREADAIHAPSRNLASIIKGQTKLRGKVRVIPTGIDTELFRPARSDEVSRLKDELGLGEGLVVLFTGRYEYRKGVHILLEAFAKVLEGSPKATLVCAGGDTETAPAGGSMLNYLQKRARELGIEKRVMLLSRFPFEKLPALYSAADVFAAPSLYENFANTILEAMSCGLPVVSTNSGGSPEMIEDSQNGFLVPPGDVPSLARAIARMLDEKEARERFGNNNAAKARDLFSREKMAEGFLELCESLV